MIHAEVHNDKLIDQSIWYEEEERMTLIFHDNRVYEYNGITKEIYEEFVKAESQESYFKENIKTKHNFLKIENDVVNHE